LSSNQNDFDFLRGAWTVVHRRLKERLKGATLWESFKGKSVTKPILGGFGNLEDNFIEFPDGGFNAVALRSFNADTGLWAIWWLDGRNPHKLDVPVIGSFENGIGTFFGYDEYEGNPIRVRFQWTHESENHCLWRQAFSADDGQTWETNWIMEFTRSA
jgi:hypothetical protein